jgi:hypothetical protein
MRQHVSLLGILLVVQGAVVLLGAIIVMMVMVTGGLVSGDMQAIAITSTVGLAIGAYLLLLAVPSLLAGLGLLHLKPWARLLALVVCCLALLKVPLGTALGIYGLWALTREETTALFANTAADPQAGGR